MKRFWTAATSEWAAGSFRVLLDGKPMRLPGGGRLEIARAALAEAIAAEWQAAGGKPGGEMSFADVPLTGLAGTVQERIAPDPAPTVTALSAYAASDLLCYRATAGALVERQARLWDPWLDWAELSAGVRLRVTSGVMPVSQPPEALAAMSAMVGRLAPELLGALGVAVPALGSLVLGLAVVLGRLAAAAAHELACLDETYQEESWGTDEAAAARRRTLAADVALAERFVALAQGGE